MKKHVIILPVVLLIAIAAFAAELPQFENFPSEKIYEGKNSPVNLATSEAREFRTRLKEASAQKTNFAGHYILTRWGCGSDGSFYYLWDGKHLKLISSVDKKS